MQRQSFCLYQPGLNNFKGALLGQKWLCTLAKATGKGEVSMAQVLGN